jgi:hypothetical protein
MRRETSSFRNYKGWAIKPTGAICQRSNGLRVARIARSRSDEREPKKPAAHDGFQGGEPILSDRRELTAKTPRSPRVHRENRGFPGNFSLDLSSLFLSSLFLPLCELGVLAVNFFDSFHHPGFHQEPNRQRIRAIKRPGWPEGSGASVFESWRLGSRRCANVAATLLGGRAYFLRWRILLRIRRFLRPTFRRPFPRRRLAIHSPGLWRSWENSSTRLPSRSAKTSAPGRTRI